MGAGGNKRLKGKHFSITEGRGHFAFPSSELNTAVISLVVCNNWERLGKECAVCLCRRRKKNLTFICPYIANIFAAYNQQDATFHNLFISVRRCTYFRRVFRPSSGAQNCTYSVRYWSDKYLTLYVQFWAPGDGRKNRLKHVEGLTEINKLGNVASCWLYAAKVLEKFERPSRTIFEFRRVCLQNGRVLGWQCSLQTTKAMF